MLRAADEKWNPPSGAHIGSNDFSAFCIHDGKDTSFVIAYHGGFDSTSRSSSNAKARTWTDSVTLTAKQPGIALSFHRTHIAPGKLSITTAPAEDRDLSKPAPAPRDFGQKEYDLAMGRVFLLTDSGTVRQLDLPTPVVTDHPAAKKLAALIAAIPPQVREDSIQNSKLTLQDDRPVARTVDEVPIPGDWLLQPREAAFVRLFHSNEKLQDGRTMAAWKEQVVRVQPQYSYTAEMSIEKAPAGAWTGKLVTGATRGSADVAAAPAPKHKNARTLYESWQRLARANGDIPGALVGELAAAVRQFIKYNPTWETVPKLNAILPRLDATRDWTAAETIALLDELAAVKDSPLLMASWRERPLRKGEKLPEKFADAEWRGAPGGLRVAWVLEPGRAEHRIGAALKARLLVWNPGAVAVVLQVPTFHQGGVTASDAKGAEVEVEGISFLTLAESVPVRLAPGEFIEINTPGVGIGERAGREPWAGPSVGFNVLAKPGTDITLSHSPVPLDGNEVGMREDDPHVVGPGWWLAYIKSRLARQLPLPADAAERTRLLDRAVRDLFAAAPTAEETAAFTADDAPDALAKLTARLQAKPRVEPFSGKLPTGETKFRVIAADPNAAKAPRTANSPGRYVLGDGVHLQVRQVTENGRRANSAEIIFLSPDPKSRPEVPTRSPAPGKATLSRQHKSRTDSETSARRAV